MTSLAKIYEVISSSPSIALASEIVYNVLLPFFDNLLIYKLIDTDTFNALTTKLRRIFEEGRAGTLSRESLAIEVYMMIKGLNIPDELKDEVLLMLRQAIETRVRVLRLEEETAVMAELSRELGLPIPTTREQQVEAMRRVMRRLRDILEEERRREEVEGGS